MVDGGLLFVEREIAARGSIGVDDLFRKQVPDRLPWFGHVGSKNEVEATILANDHDHVLDGTSGFLITRGWRWRRRRQRSCAGKAWAEGKLEHRKSRQPKAEVMGTFRCNAGETHLSSCFWLCVGS